MSVVTDIPSVGSWLEGRAERVLVVSPHLDDAALSLADQLRGLPAHVVTVITTADATTDPGWAQTCGFSDAFAEFAGRRAEDEAAMRAIGVPFTHAGIVSGSLTEHAAEQMINAVLTEIGEVPTLTLLPLGAGGVSGSLDRLRRRIMRTPFGSPVHPEHLWVRDHLASRLPGPIGYYAELPYHWSNKRAELTRLATSLIKGQIGRVTQKVNADFKHETVCLYTSQVPVELGRDPAYQRKVCAADEIVFLPL